MVGRDAAVDNFIFLDFLITLCTVKIIDNKTIEQALAYPALIERLRKNFADRDAVIPPRTHLAYEGKQGAEPSTLLMMPAWSPYKNLGVKIVTVSPANGEFRMPSVQGLYVLFDANNGQCTHVFDASILTIKRTAATSALASSYLSQPDSEVLLMIGTGALAPELIKAHASVRPIKKVLVWGRNYSKAIQVCEKEFPKHLLVEPMRDLGKAFSLAHIITCATLSKDPLVKGVWLNQGQHIDLVGSYRPDMREADDEVISRAKIFVDTYDGALKDSGDLAIPMKNKLIERADIQAELHELCNGSKQGRKDKTEITLFKSVGNALEDLTAAQMVAALLQLEK